MRCGTAGPFTAAGSGSAGSSTTTGRGLGIVASLADEWGYAAEPDGTLVWARLADRTGQRRTRARIRATAATMTAPASA
jgi:hypothetical protein